MKVVANQIQIEVEDSAPASPHLPVVLLIMGLGMQLVAWPPGLVRGVINSGYRVIRFDNRDIGLSQKFDQLGVPNVMWQGLKYKLGMNIKAPYSLHDMALDAVGVLDALKIERAHVVGVSMGGMVAQRVALLAPQRCLSLTSIMSSSGARGLPSARPEITRLMFSRPADDSIEAAIDRSVKMFKAIGSPGFPMDHEDRRAGVAYSVKRSYYPQGILRQMMAILADGARAAELTNITTPTLVVHGKADPLVPYACGEDTSRRIPGAKLVGIEGMGHDLPPGVIEGLLPLLLAHMQTKQVT